MREYHWHSLIFASKVVEHLGVVVLARSTACDTGDLATPYGGGQAMEYQNDPPEDPLVLLIDALLAATVVAVVSGLISPAEGAFITSVLIEIRRQLEEQD